MFTNTIEQLKATKEHLKAFKVGFEDGFEQGAELSTGMSYDEPRAQDVYDAGTHIGCGVAVLLRRGWAYVNRLTELG